jgi:hypothetical protein
MTSSVSEINIVSPVHNPEGTLEKALRCLLGCADNGTLPTAESLIENPKTQPPAVVSWNPSHSTMEYIGRLGYQRIHRFAVLPSRQSARWLLPQGGGRKRGYGFRHFYTPFSTKARIWKNLVVRMMAVGMQGWLQGLMIASKEQLPLERLITEVTREERATLAFSLGIGGPFTKMTVQVMRPTGETLGYIKLPLGDKAQSRLRHEAVMLERLQGFPKLRPHLAHPLYAGLWEGAYVLFQSRLTGNPGPTRFTQLHENFLQVLQDCHRVCLSGTSLIQSVADKWERTMPRLGSRWQDLGREVLRSATRELDAALVPCGILHGDFAPWNTRVHNDELSLFDWESAVWEAPLGWDKFHFLVQVDCLLNKGRGAGLPSILTNGERGSYLLYLLKSGLQLVEEDASPIGIEHREKLLRQQLSGELPI